MGDSTDTDSKTEEPTEKKLHDAAERGDTPMSREVTLLASLTAILVVTTMMLPARALTLATLLSRFIDDPGGWGFQTSDDVLALYRSLVLNCASVVGPMLLVFMAFGVLSSVAQQPPRVVADRIAPKFSRISPRQGATRILGARGWTEFGKNLIKLSAVGVIVFLILRGQKNLILDSMTVDIADLPRRMILLVGRLVTAVLVATLAVASADLAWTRILWRRDQRMSKQEIKEELRQIEGDRLMKARLRSIRLDRSRKRMLAAVPKATMVVVNPTHYAVALRYVRNEGGAPMVMAKGVDLIALKIREIAEEARVPIVEDKLLARSLYKAVSVEQAIPPEFYRAVAEIVHILQTRDNTWPLIRNRIEA